MRLKLRQKAKQTRSKRGNGDMRDKHTRRMAVQWAVPTGILLIAIIAMFADFYTTSSDEAESQIEKNFSVAAGEYASKFGEQLASMQRAGKTVTAVIRQHSEKELGLAEELVEALYHETDAYMVIMVNLDGRGINQDKEWVSLYDVDYLEQLKDGNEKFLYLEDDGFSGVSAFLAVLPIGKKEAKAVLLMYYPADGFDRLIKKGDFDDNAFYVVTDASGEIMEGNVATETVFEGGNLWDGISDEKEVRRIQNRIKNSSSGITNIKDGTASYCLAYSPVGINDWYVAIGVNQEYAKRLQRQAWNNTKVILYRLLIAIFAFLGVILILNIVGKIRSHEENRDLADKADTDLLTGLNNKLATERKIKEYMGLHPDEQALMFVLDIDNFKKINDTMGHAFGDEVIRTLGHQIRGEFRVSDIIGRIGGDEFMIFLKNLKDDSLVEQEANRVAKFFANFQAGEYVKYSATASIGAAVYPRDASDFESLYKAADKALYKAKERGKNQLAFYKEDN